MSPTQSAGSKRARTQRKSAGKQRSRPDAKSRRRSPAVATHLPWFWIAAAATVLHLPMLVVRLSNAPYLPWLSLRPLAAYVPSVILSAFWLRAMRYRGDQALPGTAMLMVGVGMAVQVRIGRLGTVAPAGVAPDWMLPAAGVLAIPLTLSLCRLFGLERLRRFWGAAGLAALGVAALMMVFGRRYRGGLYLPGLVTPTEVLKPLLAVAMAGFLSGHAATLRRGVWPGWPFVRTLTLLWAPIVALLFLQRDLGMLILLNAMLAFTLYAVSRHRGQFVVVALMAMSVIIALARVSAHAGSRFQAWLNPFADPTGSGWQVLQSLSAMYAGGWWGAGIGAGAPQSVPIVVSDFVYAAWAEETGLFGCLLLVYMAALLVSRAWTAAGQARTDFARSLGAALAALFGVQTLLNLGGVTRALPLTGIPLPFVSHGGSSLLTLCVCVGLLSAVSDSAVPGGKQRRRKSE